MGLDELEQAENPAQELLQQLGWTYLPAYELGRERGDEREVLLKQRLQNVLLRLNEWMTSEQAERVIFSLEHLDEVGMARNQKVHEYLTYGMTLDVDGPGGRRTRTVRFFDFEHPAGGLNEFIVTTQFRVSRGETIVPDLVLFVNGIPLVVMEAKSPDLGLWRTEAIRQLHRYQENGRKWRGRGAPALFHYNLLCVVHCGTEARFGALYAPENAYFEWKSILPYTDEEVRRRFGLEPGGQARLIVGLLSPAVLLDILRDFVVYEHQGGRLVKKLPRYQQYRTVRAAVERIRRGNTPEERGGVVWHTQGSGKSLTMLWLAVKLRREARLGVVDNPTILVVTDRVQLDRQITSTFEGCSFPAPEQAKNTRDLRRLLTSGVGRTVMTTVQKFEEVLQEDDGRAEALNPSANAVVMVDEAHRTQYGILAARMSQALPNAALIGFTGTPIDKGFERSTRRRFGELIDSYTIPESVIDGATVPIKYELRKPELSVIGPDVVDRLFNRLFGHLTEDQQVQIRRRYANLESLAEAERRIQMIAEDIAGHFIERIRPNRFRGQVVAPSRAAALQYARHLRDFGIPETYPIITVTPEDGAEYDRVRELNQEQLVKAFVEDEDGPGVPEILVVVDKLRTGFDAPREQVLYLDKGVREHDLLQTIARVNRRFTHEADGVSTEKTYGLIVDYHGVSQELEKALAGFQWGEVREAMEPLETGDEIGAVMEEAAARAERWFRGKDLDDVWECVLMFAPDAGTEREFKIDLYQRFNGDYRRFAYLMDRFLPDPRALAYRERLRRLTVVRSYVRAQYMREDAEMDWTDIGAKAKKLVDERIDAAVKELMKPISILHPDFERTMAGLPGERERASLMEHALRAEINKRFGENPAFYQNLSEVLEEVIGQLRQGTLDDLEACRRMEEMVGRMHEEGDIAARLGLTRRGYAYYEMLLAELDEPTGDAGDLGEYRQEFEEEMVRLAGRLDDAVEKHTAIIDWRDKPDVQREMRRDVKRILREGGEYTQDHLDELSRCLVEIARRRTEGGGADA